MARHAALFERQRRAYTSSALPFSAAQRRDDLRRLKRELLRLPGRAWPMP
jgi:hypothetical protein